MSRLKDLRPWRCGALCALAIIAWLGARHARAGGATGFDHNVHDRDVAVSGAEAIACARCHPMKGGALVGRPDHQACFTSCHGGTPPASKRGTKLAIASELRAVCVTCHSDAALDAPVARRMAVAFPPYTLGADFALTVGHKAHREAACAACHGDRRGAPHARCAGCHDGSKRTGRGTAMTECRTCHQPGSGVPEPPRLQVRINTVTATFSHRSHAARGGAGNRCVTCHAEIRDTDDNTLPRPTATTCAVAGCHDGKASFGITRSCRTCHRAPEGEFDVARPTARYSHATHTDTKLACTGCHPITAAGEVVKADHQPCVGCHADDFGKRSPVICGACHNATEPWRALVADRMPPERTEFGATLDHRTHTAACASCHMLTTATQQLRMPRGHRACTGAGCHAVRGGPVPSITACDGCHQLGLANQRQAARTKPAWSVRARFDHRPHMAARDASPVACERCHTDLGASSIIELPAPAKATCVPCHDGVTAFKLTGTNCARCHAAAEPAPAHNAR
ncbi:MAG: cytochrome c3 family protein [Kofleriaceae bacterium]